MSHVTEAHTRFSADEFVRMVNADVFGTTRVELLNGRVYVMTQLDRHVFANKRATQLFNRIQPPGDYIVYGATLKLDRWSMPDPDVMWLPVPEGTLAAQWPTPILVVELSDTTYKKDSGRKLRKYAYHGLPEYWIENLKADRIEVYRDPQNPTGKEKDCSYASVTHVGRGGTLTVLARPDVTIAADDLLP